MPAMTFLGDGTENYFGIPARDLTADEYDALTDEQKALVDGSRLYASVTAPKSAKDAPPPVEEAVKK